MRRLVLLLVVLLAELATAPAHGQPRPGFRWPLPGMPAVTRGFQPPQTAWGPGHRGVDLEGYDGERVLASGAGRVTYAGLLAGRGVVAVSHPGGLRTTYEPVTPTVRVGARVAEGSVLGSLRAGHASCRAAQVCLHWGLLRGHTYLDPLALVRPAPVRLLPLGRDAAGRAAAREPVATDASSERALDPPAESRARVRTASGVAALLAAGVALLTRRRTG